MDEISYNGKRYTRFGNYFRSSRKFLHRAIWEDSNGAIPDGYHIHHIDGDRENNDLSNLEAKDGRAHISEHQRGHTRRPNAAIAAQAIWRSTAEGKEFLRQSGLRNQHFMRKDAEFVCDCCKKSFVARANGENRFCSNACKSKQRRKDGTDLIDASCKFCGNGFRTNKFKPSANCGKRCARSSWVSTPEGKAHIERLASAKRGGK